MTDFASLLIADRGQKARPIHLVDKGSFADWAKGRSPADRALLEAQRFDGKTGFASVLLPAGDGEFEVVSAVADAAELSPWCLAKLAETLARGPLSPGRWRAGSGGIWLAGRPASLRSLQDQAQGRAGPSRLAVGRGVADRPVRASGRSDRAGPRPRQHARCRHGARRARTIRSRPRRRRYRRKRRGHRRRRFVAGLSDDCRGRPAAPPGSARRG